MKTKILVRAPALSQSGYGEQARFALRALRSREDLYDIYLANINWGNTSWICTDDEERRWIDSILQKTIVYQNQGGGYDVSLQITIPNEFVQLAPKNIGYTAGIEATSVSPGWIAKADLMDHVIVVSNHSKEVYERTKISAVDENGNVVQENYGVSTPITVVNFPVKDINPRIHGLEFSTSFNFLSVAQWGPRKNLNRTIKWFIEEFVDNEDIGLVIKANISKNCVMDRRAALARLEATVKKYPNKKCKIYLLHGHMTEEEMTGLYQHPQIKSYVTMTHGEGFGLPIFEAVYNGLPIIAPLWSGQNDYLYMPVKDKKGKVKQKAMCAKIDYNLQQIPKEAIWKGVLEEHCLWAFPESGSYKMRLREVYKDLGRFKSQANKLQDWVKENFTAEQKYKEFVDCISETCSTENKAVQEVVVL